jgi:WD40 repeat protein
VQYELRDLRAPEQVLSSFGWTPKVKHAQGPGTVGTWSPGGVLIASGATDPEIHLFDIRKKGNTPLVSLRTEQKTKKSLWYRGGSVLVSSCAERNSICVSRLNL